MSDYQFIEIIFLAAIAGFILYRLYTTLGQDPNRDENQHKVNRKDSQKSNVIPMRKGQDFHDHEAETVKVVDPLKNAKPELLPLLKKDPEFDEVSFLDGATWAFGTIVEGFAKGNLPDIKKYLSKKVHETFKKALKSREEMGEVQNITVIAVKEAQVVRTAVTKGVAEVTVRFVSDQDIAITDKDGNDLHPDHEEIEEVTDIWTFARPIDSSDPNWQLTTIHNVETFEVSKDSKK